MARPLRIAYKGAIYHVNVRGHSRSLLFRDDYDRKKFLGRLSQDVEFYKIRLYCYCLIPNHYHLVLETPHANISAFMQTLQTSYHRYFNKRHDRLGQVSQGRFKAKLVEGDEYLLQLSRYVHLNPVQTERCRKLSFEQRLAMLGAYRWSSFCGYINSNMREAFVDYDPMLGLVQARTGNSYQAYVESGLAQNDVEFMKAQNASPRAIGSPGFLEEVEARYEELVLQSKTGRAPFRRMGTFADAGAVLATVGRVLGLASNEFLLRRRGSWNRAIALRMLCRFSGSTRRDAGNALQIASGSAVSMQLQALEEELERNRGLRSRVDLVETECGKLITGPPTPVSVCSRR